MKTVLYIFGDSFSSETDDHNAWVNLLKDIFEVKNYSQRGISEYRIWKNYRIHKDSLQKDSRILFCHTSPYRIYLKDSYCSISRNLKTHPYCDIILKDIYSKNEKDLIKIVESIWDEDYFEDHFNLVLEELLRVKNSFHISFFDLSANILNLNLLWKNHQGKINHLDIEGNRLAAEKIIDLITQ